jgi:hypothetical protein
MTEMSSGLRTVEMYERQAWHRARAQRELTGVAVDRPRRRLLRGRTGRPDA